MQLRVGDAGAAYASFAEAQQRQPPLDAVSLPKRDAYYVSLLQAGLAKLYTSGQDYERGVLAHEAVVKVCDRFGLHTRLPYHYLELGPRANAVGGYGWRLQKFRIDHSTLGGAGPIGPAAALANLGYYASLAADFERAARLFEEAEHNFRASATDTHADLVQVYVWRAEMAQRQGNTDRQAELLEVAFGEASLGEDVARQALVCQHLATYHADAGDFEQAYHYRLLYEELQSAVADQRNARRISELELRHELEQRRSETELLNLRATELQLKALRAQMNPHFIFNALNAIQESITSQRAGDAAAHLAAFARLMRQSLEYSERSSITLEEEIAFLAQYLSLNQALRYRAGFTFEIVVDQDLEEDLIRVPAMLVQPYLENALEHGLRLSERGHVRLAFASPPDDEDILVITIEDNGIGRAAAAVHTDRSPTHKSMGTTITRHRLDLLNRGSQQATVSYTDLTTASGQASGTRVTITLPIRWSD